MRGLCCSQARTLLVDLESWLLQRHLAGAGTIADEGELSLQRTIFKFPASSNFINPMGHDFSTPPPSPELCSFLNLEELG